MYPIYEHLIHDSRVECVCVCERERGWKEREMERGRRGRENLNPSFRKETTVRGG